MVEISKFKNKRICVLIDDDVDKKLRTHQAQLIRKNNRTWSYSKALNHALRIALGVKNE